MRLARCGSAGEPGPAGDQPSSDPAPGSPVSAFAGILDGQSLWLAVQEQPGSLALRDTATAEVVALRSDLLDDQPGYLSTRSDLACLPGAGQAAYDVVLVSAGDRVPQAVWTPPLTASRPPPARDGRTQYALHRDGDGMLQVRRGSLPPAAVLRAVQAVADGLALRLDRAGSAVALLDDEDTVHATFPTSGADGTTTALLTPAALPVGVTAMTRVLTDDEDGAWRPVRRHANDLAEPGRGVPLPHLYDEQDRARLRLRWSPEGLLLARLFPVEGGDG